MSYLKKSGENVLGQIVLYSKLLHSVNFHHRASIKVVLESLFQYLFDELNCKMIFCHDPTLGFSLQHNTHERSCPPPAEY